MGTSKERKEIKMSTLFNTPMIDLTSSQTREGLNMIASQYEGTIIFSDLTLDCGEITLYVYESEDSDEKRFDICSDIDHEYTLNKIAETVEKIYQQASIKYYGF